MKLLEFAQILQNKMEHLALMVIYVLSLTTVMVLVLVEVSMSLVKQLLVRVEVLLEKE